jgi:hypothetical protein
VDSRTTALLCTILFVLRSGYERRTGMKNSCVGCKYNFRSDKKEPCKTGVWNIYYSGECLQYKPSLKTKLKKVAKKER